MKPFVIITDSCCDLSKEFILDNNIPFLGMMCNFKGTTFEDDFGKSLDYKAFYDDMRKGELSSTSQITAYRFEELFRKYVSEGYDVLYLAFSSALSGTCDSAIMASKTIMEEFNDSNVTVIDTKSASLGEGLLVYYAYEMKKKGASLDEIARWVEENKLKVLHWITVDDLNHLKRGGRVSATSAFIGSILDIKPVLHVNNEGKLIPVIKAKGRKKSIKILAEKFKKQAIDAENQVVFIGHGDCMEDAKLLEKYIREENTVKDIIVNTLGPTVGSHTGPNVLTVFFLGRNREE